VFTKAHHSPAYLSKIHFNIILPSMPRSSEWFFTPDFSTVVFYVFLISPMHTTCPVNLIFLDLVTLIISSFKSTSYEVLHWAVFSIFLSFPPSKVQRFSTTPCSQTPSIYVITRGQAWHPYKTTGRIQFRICFRLKMEDKRFWIEW